MQVSIVFKPCFRTTFALALRPELQRSPLYSTRNGFQSPLCPSLSLKLAQWTAKRKAAREFLAKVGDDASSPRLWETNTMFSLKLSRALNLSEYLRPLPPPNRKTTTLARLLRLQHPPLHKRLVLLRSTSLLHKLFIGS